MAASWVNLTTVKGDGEVLIRLRGMRRCLQGRMPGRSLNSARWHACCLSSGGEQGNALCASPQGMPAEGAVHAIPSSCWSVHAIACPCHPGWLAPPLAPDCTPNPSAISRLPHRCLGGARRPGSACAEVSTGHYTLAKIALQGRGHSRVQRQQRAPATSLGMVETEAAGAGAGAGA